MKKIFSILFLCCFFSSKSQILTPINGYGQKHLRLQIDSFLKPPSDTINNAPLNSIAVKNSIVYTRNYTKWDAIKSLTFDSTKYFKQDGNSFGMNAKLGTIDNYDLRFKTYGTEHLILGTDGSFYSPTQNWSFNTDYGFQLGSNAGFSPSGDLKIPHSRYINYAQNDGQTGSDGFGFRDSAGINQFKDSSGIWKCIGTVKSVSATVPTGFSISGSPITTSGTLGITYASGYSLPTTASQSLWDVAYTNRITSLTTTGSSGAATLSSNVLNIPTPTVSGLGGIDSIRLVNTGVIFTTPAAFSKVGTTGVITQTLATQTANKFLASPNGSSGALTVRSIVNADLPKRIDSTENTLPSVLITFTGTTAPSGTTYNTYEWSQNGRVVTFRLNLSYSVAASGITTVVIAIPTDMPAPSFVTDPLSPNTNDVFIPLSCNGGNTRTIINPLSANINRNGGTPAIRIVCASQNIQYLQIAGSYFTNN